MPGKIRVGSGWNKKLEANIEPFIHVKGHWEVDPDSAHSLPDGKWFVSKIPIRFLQISFHRDNRIQNSLWHLLCRRSRSGLPPCLHWCQWGVCYCGPQNPSRASLHFIRTVWYGVRMIGRAQIIHVGNRHSSPFKVLYGIPQGSVLGPVLYVHYHYKFCSQIEVPEHSNCRLVPYWREFLGVSGSRTWSDTPFANT